MKAYITKIAYVLPEKVSENPKSRLTKKTGIHSRHICGADEIASDLAMRAAEQMLIICYYVRSHQIIICQLQLAFCRIN